jgi:hypothetical protein
MMPTRTLNKPNRTTDNAALLGCGMEMQASIWYWQCRLEDARSEVLGALEIHERLGGARRAESCRTLLRAIEGAMGSQTSGKADPDGEFSSNDPASGSRPS